MSDTASGEYPFKINDIVGNLADAKEATYDSGRKVVVSVDMQRQDATATQPVAVADLHAYFHAAAKAPEDFRVGAEFEKFAIEPATGRALSYDEPGGIPAILIARADPFCLQPPV